MEEADFLLPFERRNYRRQWRSYLSTCRQNSSVSIERFSFLWGCFQLLDEVFSRELENAAIAVSPLQSHCLILMFEAHSRFRTATELAFATTVLQAWSVFRGAIEYGAHAHKLHRQPSLLRVWLDKNDGPQQRKAYKKHFEEYKAQNLFPQQYPFLHELHGWWKNYSEWGPHSGLAGIALKTEARERGWNFNYFETNERRLVSMIFGLLHSAWLVENVLHDMFKDRFSLDPTLQSLREQLQNKKQEAARTIVRVHRIPRPEAPGSEP